MGALEQIQEAIKTGTSNLTIWDNETHALPQEIGQLTNLVSLTLGCKCLTTLPPEIGRLQNLTSLELLGGYHRYYIQTSPTSQELVIREMETLPAEIGQLKNLKSLKSSGLQSLPPEIGQLENLKFLQMSDLETIPPEIGLITNLEVLIINTWAATIPVELRQLSNLIKININCGSKRITTSPFDFYQLKKLKELKISYPHSEQAIHFLMISKGTALDSI